MSWGTPSSNRSAVDHQRRPVDAAQRNETARHVLVAARDRDQPVVPLPAHDRLDRVGDQVAGLQRVAHSVGTHRDAVADTDGIELQAKQAGLSDALFAFPAEVQQVHVARVSLVPHARDADLSLVHVLFGHAGCIQHGLRRAL